MEVREVDDRETRGASRCSLEPAVKDLNAAGQIADYRVVELA